MFGTCRRQTETELDGGFEVLRVKRKAEYTIYARLSEGILAFRRNRKRDDGHFARCSDFPDLVDGFDGALRARLEARSRQQVVRREDHEVKFFPAGFVREFIKANGPGSLDAGAVVADVENYDFNHVANTAIRIANQKVERFHQFEKCNRLVEWGGMRAFLPVAKQGVCQSRTYELPWA